MVKTGSQRSLHWVASHSRSSALCRTLKLKRYHWKHQTFKRLAWLCCPQEYCMCMHFYLNIHISRLFNLRFIRTHPFKSIRAREQILPKESAVVGGLVESWKPRKLQKRGKVGLNCNIFKSFFCFSFWRPGSRQRTWHGPDWLGGHSPMFLWGVKPSSSDQVDCRRRPAVWDSKGGERGKPFIVQSGTWP